MSTAHKFALKFVSKLSFLALACQISTAVLAQSFVVEGTNGNALQATPITQIDAPWAMTFIDASNLLVTSKYGQLWWIDLAGAAAEIGGLPEVTVAGQGGLGDVVLHPDFAQNRLVYLSYVETEPGGYKSGAVVVRGQLDLASKRLVDLQRIWTQEPKVSGSGHFSHRLAFGPKNSEHAGKLFITSGDRQVQTPAQDMKQALGKLIRLNDDGSVPGDNPYQTQGELAKTFWSIGHRNPLGVAFDERGKLWANEMGPRHGDELNLIRRGQNYGWPIVSNGDQYSGVEIPDHDTRPDLAAPAAYWVPSIAPSGLVIYSGDQFSAWRGDALIGGLRSRAVIRVRLNGEQAQEVERFEWGARIREVEQGPDGALWVLEDGQAGRLLKLEPR